MAMLLLLLDANPAATKDRDGGLSLMPSLLSCAATNSSASADGMIRHV
jgi:hypothetical protein